MAHSTSLSSPAPERPAVDSPRGSQLALDRVRRFYKWQAGLYDYTRPWLLRGRSELIDELPARLDVAVDVGSGTGFALPGLLRIARQVIAVEPSPDMRHRAQRRVAKLAASARVTWDTRPYGTPSSTRANVDAVVFSYSLSMIPEFESAVERAEVDLAPGGQIAVVDFVSARWRPFGDFLTRCHVDLGEERLEFLQQRFPQHTLSLRRGPLWSYFLFWGRRPTDSEGRRLGDSPTARHRKPESTRAG